jgi:predicted RNA-binding Zn-ribbon protein involved in translation (DUF1610 family)
MSGHRLGRLEVQIHGARMALAGRFDDGVVGLPEMAANLPAGDVTIDLEGITFVNSVGMREWMRLVRVLRDRGTITLARVAEGLMGQMNLIPEFKGAVRIASFHAQYACPKCGAEADPLIDAVAHLLSLRAKKFPAMACPECGSAMELAEFPERYLTLFGG